MSTTCRRVFLDQIGTFSSNSCIQRILFMNWRCAAQRTALHRKSLQLIFLMHMQCMCSSGIRRIDAAQVCTLLLPDRASTKAGLASSLNHSSVHLRKASCSNPHISPPALPRERSTIPSPSPRPTLLPCIVCSHGRRIFIISISFGCNKQHHRNHTSLILLINPRNPNMRAMLQVTRISEAMSQMP
jgi:hypothetical protein